MMKASRARYVIVQAGGQGSRLGAMTVNKPKCLLSVGGEPLLYRMFGQYDRAQFVIIGDYHFDALSRYLDAVPPGVRHTLVQADGKGTAAGVSKALEHIPEDCPFVLTWCDLHFPEPPDIDIGDIPVVALTDRFPCRWSVDESQSMTERTSSTNGIVGYFGFPHKAWLAGVPDEGEFVRHLSTTDMRFTTVLVPGVREFGTLDVVQAHERKNPTRFFNEIEMRDSEVVKKSRRAEFDGLLTSEADWYQRVAELGFQFSPRMRRRYPLVLERLNGRHPFELVLDQAEQRLTLANIVETLSRLHSLDSAAGALATTWEMYWEKTVSRLETVRKLIPNADDPCISVNGVRCRNPISDRHFDWFTEMVVELGHRPYALTHGDPTFSNILVDESRQAWLIDPRGTFGSSRLLGEARYDWAKVLYSVEGNYDQFNRRRFALRNVGRSAVEVEVASNGWEGVAELFYDQVDVTRRELQVIHALIWLSLSGYVLDDFDSILAAYYRGVRLLEHAEGH